MPPQGSATISSAAELGILAEFIYELNIARRHLSTYPPGHPMIEGSADKVLKPLDRLFELRDKVTLGISKDALHFDGEWLDRKNPVFQDFAANLYRLGVAAISFLRRPERDELMQVSRLFCSDRQAIVEGGGFVELLAQRRIRHIEITAVDYSTFQTTENEQPDEDQAASLWEDLITGLLAGVPYGGDGSQGSGQDFNPQLIADVLNRNSRQQQEGSSQDIDQVIAAFISKIQSSGSQPAHIYSRFAELIDHLTPELRRQFLHSAFNHLNPTNPATKAFLEKLSTAAILAALEDLSHNRMQISDTMVNLLGKLAEHRQPGMQSLTIGKSTENDQQKEKLDTIFREEERGKFTPEAYQQALNSIISFEESDYLKSEENEQLRQQLTNSSIERHCCVLLLKLLRPDLDTGQAQGIQNNLIDLAHFFLEVGDFKGLRFLHCGTLNYLNQCPQSPPGQTDRLLETLSSPQFQQEVLDSLKHWGEDKQKEIRDYIKATGSLFAESLVNHLATEESMGIRRLYVNTLVSLGQAAHQAVYDKLTDRRWFLVRNLLSVLRLQNDPIRLEPIFPLEKHPHPRVNQELLKLLFKYDQSRADNLLLKQLTSTDPEIQAHAIQLAELSRNPTIVDQLLTLLDRDKVTKHNLAVKISLVKSLGQIGSEKALPQLEKLLFSGWLFVPAPLKQLKLEIVRNLGNYPFARLQQPLTKLTRSRQKDLRRLAEKKLRQLAGGRHGQ